MSFIAFVFFVLLTAYGAAQSEEDRDPIGIVTYNFVRTKDGYEFNYELGDGSYRKESGIILNPGTDEEELVVKGEYGGLVFDSSLGDYKRKGIEYTADKNGYRPYQVMSHWLSGELLPAEISPSLLKSLAG